jgi:hypothetical protein
MTSPARVHPDFQVQIINRPLLALVRALMRTELALREGNQLTVMRAV